MSDFDPYLKWLGIRETNRPINHYRLLGLDLFESDPDVISMAADRQMAHIRTYQNGPHGEVSQKILNELARARRCLLVPEQKDQYDQDLRLASVRVDVNTSKPSSNAAPTAQPAAAQSTFDVNVTTPKVVADPNAREKTKGREKKQLMWSIVGWISGGVAAVGVSAYLIGSGILPMGGNNTEDPGNTQVAAQGNNPDKKLVTEPANIEPNGSTNNPSTSNDNTNTFSDDLPPTIDNGTAIAPPIDDSDTNVDPDGNSTPDVNLADTGLTPIDHVAADIVSIDGPIMPADGEWTLGNSSNYPVDTDQLLPLLERLDSLKESESVLEGPHSSVVESQTYRRDIPETTSLLIGMRVWINQQSVVTAMQGIYLNPDGVIAGQRYGTDSRFYRDFIAKPGYAVSGLSISAVAPVQNVALHFSKLTSTGFDPNEKYTSERIGVTRGPLLTIVPAAVLNPVIGLQFGVHRFEEYKKKEMVASVSLLGVGTSTDVAATDNMDEDPFKPDVPTDNGTSSPTAASPISSKTPIPNSLDQSNAKERLKEDYQRDLDRIARERDATNRYRLIVRVCDLMRDRARVTNDTTEKFVLLNQVIELSAGVGEAGRVVDALRMVDLDFDIDYWEKVLAALELTAPNVSDSNRQVVFKDTIDQLVFDAVDTQEFDIADELVTRANKAAAGNAVLRAWYKQQSEDVDELKKIHKLYKEALLTLETSADDAKANLAVGDYLFLYGEDGSAYPYWAKSSNIAMTKVASAETEADRNTAEGVLDLAEAWKRVGRGKKTIKRTKALRNAYDYYSSAIQLLEGSKREKVVEERDELEQLLSNRSNLDPMFE